jgi:hypothetical protein
MRLVEISPSNFKQNNRIRFAEENLPSKDSRSPNYQKILAWGLSLSKLALLLCCKQNQGIGQVTFFKVVVLQNT